MIPGRSMLFFLLLLQFLFIACKKEFQTDPLVAVAGLILVEGEVFDKRTVAGLFMDEFSQLPF